MECSENIFHARYLPIREIGRGGFGIVYLCRDLKLGKLWAVKKVFSERREAAYREALLLKQLNHPSVPGITDIIYDSDELYIVMDYINGYSLDTDKGAEIFVRNFEESVIKILECINYFHGLSPPLVYADIKPANIIISENGDISITDFGCSIRKNETNMYFYGTRKFASPEQLMGVCADEKSDIYCFGKTVEEVFHKADTDIPFCYKKIIEKCIKSDVSKRYKNVKDVIKSIEKTRNGISIKSLYRLILVCISISILLLLLLIFKSRSDKENTEVEISQSIQLIQENLIDRGESDINTVIELLDEYNRKGMFGNDEERYVLGAYERDKIEFKESEQFDEFAFKLGLLYWYYGKGENEWENKTKRMDDGLYWFNQSENPKAYVYREIADVEKQRNNAVNSREEFCVLINCLKDLIFRVEEFNDNRMSSEVYMIATGIVAEYSQMIASDEGLYNTAMNILSEIELNINITEGEEVSEAVSTAKERLQFVEERR